MTRITYTRQELHRYDNLFWNNIGAAFDKSRQLYTYYVSHSMPLIDNDPESKHYHEIHFEFDRNLTVHTFYRDHIISAIALIAGMHCFFRYCVTFLFK